MTDEESPSDSEETDNTDPELRTDGGEAIVENPATTLPSEGPVEPAGPTGPPNLSHLSDEDASDGVDAVRIDPTASDLSTEELLQEILSEQRETLDPIAPEEAIGLYLKDKARNCAHSTINAHRSRLGFFVDWCDEQGITNLNDLSARDLHNFRVWRREGLNLVSEKTQLVTLRVFIKWCETIDAVEPDLYRKVDIPKIEDGGTRDKAIFGDRVREILEHLGRYEYASTEHVCWVILTSTGMRLGSVRALDVADYKPDTDPPYLDVRHRPETDTPLKKRTRGERPVGIKQAVCDVIDDYLQHQRPKVTDDHDREPLLATAHGRVARPTIRKYAYKWSRPYKIGQECPHGRNPLDCEAAVHLDQAAQCPSSVTPHPIRRGYITQLLQSDVPIDAVSSRCNVSPDIIEKHYDVRTEEDKMRQRQKLLDDALGDDLIQ